MKGLGIKAKVQELFPDDVNTPNRSFGDGLAHRKAEEAGIIWGLQMLAMRYLLIFKAPNVRLSMFYMHRATAYKCWFSVLLVLLATYLFFKSSWKGQKKCWYNWKLNCTGKIKFSKWLEFTKSNITKKFQPIEDIKQQSGWGKWIEELLNLSAAIHLKRNFVLLCVMVWFFAMCWNRSIQELSRRYELEKQIKLAFRILFFNCRCLLQELQ